MDAILEMRVTEPESTPIELAEDTVLDVLFKPPIETQLVQHPRTKRHHISHTAEANHEAHSRKRERTKLEQARRTCLLHEEI